MPSKVRCKSKIPYFLWKNFSDLKNSSSRTPRQYCAYIIFVILTRFYTFPDIEGINTSWPGQFSERFVSSWYPNNVILWYTKRHPNHVCFYWMGFWVTMEFVENPTQNQLSKKTRLKLAYWCSNSLILLIWGSIHTLAQT